MKHKIALAGGYSKSDRSMLVWYNVLKANCAWEGELAEVGLASLQVRYCTKLKAKDVVWTDEMVRICSSYIV